ncbi:MAG: terpene cyclase/mutase family protein [Planctomycetales bacterium]|nr:terpene cyclase/mutase family protein [Planctomycetales bacterium]
MLAVVAAALLAGSIAPASAIDFAKQQALAEKGVRYLESAVPGSGDTNVAREMLVARAIFKHRIDDRHPKVAAAVALARQVMADPVHENHKIDELGLSLTLLAELTPPQPAVRGNEHQRLCKQIYDRIIARQSPDGSWRNDSGRGDILLTRSALLAIWWYQGDEAADDSPAERACNWLLLTQSPAGAWANHSKDPGTDVRVPPEQTRLAPFVAGVSGLYIAADLLHFEQERTFSSPFQSIEPRKPTTTVIDPARLWHALDLADRYWAANAHADAGKLQLDYLHSLERYYAFRDHVRGHSVPRGGPRWYNDGVELLARTQAPDGHWASQANSFGPATDTALAILFLYHVRRDACFGESCRP